MSTVGANDPMQRMSDPRGDPKLTSGSTGAMASLEANAQLGAASAAASIGDDPAPPEEEIGPAILEFMLESVTARLPRGGIPWTPADRAAYLAAFDRFSELARMYADFWPVEQGQDYAESLPPAR